MSESCAGTGCSSLAPCPSCLDRLFAGIADDFDPTTVMTTSLPHGGTLTRIVDEQGRLHHRGVEPAICERASHSDVILMSEFYEHGIWQDVDGLPARRTNYPNGRPHVVEHAHRGLLNDFWNTSGLVIPARSVFDPQGIMIHSESWIAGVQKSS